MGELGGAMPTKKTDEVKQPIIISGFFHLIKDKTCLRVTISTKMLQTN